jgi:DNA-binding LacI/PurR family transcriptional regulator
MKPYCKYSDILIKLKEIISVSAARNELVLPGERELAVRTGASRMTLRKAMKELEAEDTIRREKNFTRITPPKRKKGKFVFVAGGDSVTGIITSHAYDRLWRHLSLMANARGFDIRLFIFNSAADPLRDSETSDDLRDANGIFVSLIGGAGAAGFFDRAHAVTPNVFALDQMMEPLCANLICLDNFAAGEMAAGEIIKSGYKKAACLGYRSPRIFTPFELRAKGFAAAMSKAGVTHDVIFEKVTSEAEFPEKVKNHIKTLRNDGYDALFFISDEWLDFILLDAIFDKAIPSRLGVIALDGSNTGRRMLPPLTCVSHASRPVAAAVVDTISEIFRKKLALPLRAFVRPEIYKGRSLK